MVSNYALFYRRTRGARSCIQKEKGEVFASPFELDRRKSTYLASPSLVFMAGASSQPPTSLPIAFTQRPRIAQVPL